MAWHAVFLRMLWSAALYSSLPWLCGVVLGVLVFCPGRRCASVATGRQPELEPDEVEVNRCLEWLEQRHELSRE